MRDNLKNAGSDATDGTESPMTVAACSGLGDGKGQGLVRAVVESDPD